MREMVNRLLLAAKDGIVDIHETVNLRTENQRLRRELAEARSKVAEASLQVSAVSKRALEVYVFVLAAILSSKSETPNKALAEAKEALKKEIINLPSLSSVKSAAKYDAFKARGLIADEN